MADRERWLTGPPPAALLLYLTSDPFEIPLIMPTWARADPILSEMIDEGHRLQKENRERRSAD